LYLSYRQNPTEAKKKYYWLYSKILTNVIKEAKRRYYNKKVLTPSNKIVKKVN